MNRKLLVNICVFAMATSAIAPAALAAEVTETPYAAVAVESTAGYFNNTGALDMTRISAFSIGGSDEDGGLVEIVAYNNVAQVAYVVAGSAGQLVTVPMTEVTTAGLAGTGVDMATLVGAIDGFVYGDMSSVAVNGQGTKLAVAIQAEGYNDDGMVAIFDLDITGAIVGDATFVACGKQPDSLVFTPDGTKILVANEGEPREGYGEGVVDPEGSVTMVDVATATAVNVSFDGVAYDANVLLKTGSTPAEDFEPEYIAASNTTAYVALQENNAIAVLDIASGTFTGVYGLGLQNFGEVALDMQDDGTINITTQENVYGIYMPDGISMAEIDGKTYIFTANEGDGREWGDEDGEYFYCNEQKGTTSPTGDVTLEEKVTWFNPADYEMLDQDCAYLYGARSFSIFEVTADGLTQVFDSGSDFETITAQLVPDNFNCSNDDVTMEDRSGKKGCEPEYAMVGVVDGKVYAFIGLERLGGVMAYDVTDPANATFVNYLNTRDYAEDIAGDVAPEGMAFVAAADSATGEALLLVANEVSGTLGVVQLDVSVQEVPEVAETETVVPEVVEPEVTTPDVVAPEVTTANTYTVQTGDSLWAIATSRLGAGTRWGEIYNLNTDTIANPAIIQIGQVLNMPS